MSTRRPRLAILSTHVIQYQAPLFRRIAEEGSLELTVLYASREGADVYLDKDMATSLQWDVNLLDGYDYKFVSKPRLVAEIASRKYDAVLFMLGWGPRVAHLALAACVLFRVPFMFYGDSSFPRPETTLRERLRAGVMRMLFGLASAFMVSGKLNADYYAHYGADRRRFFLLPWAADNDRFTSACEGADRNAIRDRYGIARDRVVLLFSAKLVARKDPMALLRAFASLRHRDRASLVFMGDGVLRPELEAFVREHAVPHVHFIGFVNQREIPLCYAMADVFVLPSLFEPRGAVLNEAMACSLPVIVSDRCGSLGDIVQEGDNALVFPAGDVDALRDALDRLVSDDALRARMAQRSRELIATWDYARGVEGLEEAMRWLTR